MFDRRFTKNTLLLFVKGTIFTWTTTKQNFKVTGDKFIDEVFWEEKANNHGKFVIWLWSPHASRLLHFNRNHLRTVDYKRFNSLGSAWPSDKKKRREQLGFNNPSNSRLSSWMGRVHVSVRSCEHLVFDFASRGINRYLLSIFFLESVYWLYFFSVLASGELVVWAAGMSADSVSKRRLPCVLVWRKTNKGWCLV